MDSTKTTYVSFPFDWTVKYTPCQIQYRKALNINEIDEVFCSIINAKGNQIEFSELGSLLGFNLQDLAETDILNIYLKGLIEYNLIVVNQELIQLTDFGQEALQSKLKYKYCFATTELFENQTATGENFDFTFKNVFDLENKLSDTNNSIKEVSDDIEKKQKLQFQLFENDIYKGQIVEFYENESGVNYKSISLQCEVVEIDNSFRMSFCKSDISKPDIHFLIDLPENFELKNKLLRKGMFHRILANKNSIASQDIKTYIDLWNWKELAENPKLDWKDKEVFELFSKNGDGSIWSIISEKAPIESIKSVINDYAEYWNWTTLTELFDNDFIKGQIEGCNWDFEELSHKEAEFVISLLSNSKLKDRDWDWNYLSKNLPDEFIEKHIEDFAWDFYVITVSKNEVFKNTFIKYRDKLEALISKNWDWKFISEEINLNFLHKNISGLASKLVWNTVLDRFFSNEEISTICLKDESFKLLLKQHLPYNFVVAHQKYLWTLDLIDFFEEQNLIQWETEPYIQGFDTNEVVEWNKPVFERYHSRITTEKGFFNVSQSVSDYRLIEQFPDFSWDWKGVSMNGSLISDTIFIESFFSEKFPFVNDFLWNEILLQSTFDLSFWNKNLQAFCEVTDNERQILFWNLLTRKENHDYIFANIHFPWDWSFITEACSAEIILESFEDEELFGKWDWKIATRKLSKEIILENLEDFVHYVDWKHLINEVFIIDNELAMDKQLPRIATCLSVVNSDERRELWKDLTAKFPFEILFSTIQLTYQSDFFEWDWDFISNHNHLPTDTRTLNKFKHKMNWSLFSENNAIQQKFNRATWNNDKEWFSNTNRYLKYFESNWDWQVLSRNKNINCNRLLLQKYKAENWDWDYLTEFGGFITKWKKDNDRYLEQIVKQFPRIEFKILSKRKDINIDGRLILLFKNKDWDWQALSENERVEISNEFLLELKDKDWNWQAISKRKGLVFNNEALLQLLDKDLDWNYLSEHSNLEFSTEFIESTKSKPWNWRVVSRHETLFPTIEVLTLIKDFDLDWKYLSQHSSLNPTKELLAKFETKWNWQSITQHLQINFADVDFIKRFADKWDWYFICKWGKLTINGQILKQFKKQLKWDLISSNTNIDFTKEIIQEFKPFWNWTILKENKRVEELLGSYVADEISKSAILNFIDKIEQQQSLWKGSIYHFSHIDNAVEIIKNRKIQSRNKANIKGDAAGNVVHRRDDAHGYARFYFRPHTPTQFYNEFLGKNVADGYENKNRIIYNSFQTGPIYDQVSWYEKARNLGFPKCPIPIFFRFSLKEVLFESEQQCCVSNGNMQANLTQFNSIDNMLGKFNFDYLYSEMSYDKENNRKYMNYSQQEFLVKDELSFNDLIDFEIICPSESDRMLLISLLGSEHKDVFSRIVVDAHYYNNKNPRVRIEEEELKLHISTNFNGDGYFVLNGVKINEIEIKGVVSKIDKDKIIFNSNVTFGNLKQNIQLNFIDESNRSWFLYSK